MLSRLTWKSLGVFVVLTCAATSAQGQMILIDFHTLAGSGGPGGTWNVFAGPGNINGGGLVDSTNTATGVTLSRSGQLSASPQPASAVFNNDAPGFVGLPTWATAAGSGGNGASGDMFYTSNVDDDSLHQAVLTFGGLTPGTAFQLDVLASRDTGISEGFYDYSLNSGVDYFGLTVMNADGTPLVGRVDTQAAEFDNEVDGFDNHRYMSIQGVVTGNALQFRMTDVNTGTNFAALNAMRLTLTPVPEPSGWLLAAACGMVGALVVGKRRKKQSGAA